MLIWTVAARSSLHIHDCSGGIYIVQQNDRVFFPILNGEVTILLTSLAMENVESHN